MWLVATQVYSPPWVARTGSNVKILERPTKSMRRDSEENTCKPFRCHRMVMGLSPFLTKQLAWAMLPSSKTVSPKEIGSTTGGSARERTGDGSQLPREKRNREYE